jgi:metal transporter CNNM
MSVVTWFGILLCISQSAVFSGLNLAIFSVSRLRLEVETANRNLMAARVLALRKNSNYTLAVVLWGNVSVNVLLTLLSKSVLTGVGAFFFSTVLITFLGEIIPQAYFSRRALRMAARMVPLLHFYGVLLFPVTKPTALLLDAWLGPEGIRYFRERDLRTLIKMHTESQEAGVTHLEATGAVNFLDLDDIRVSDEGQPIDPNSIMALPVSAGWPVLPQFERSPGDPFLRRLEASGRKWVIITDTAGEPHAVLDANGFLRSALFRGAAFNPRLFLSHPIIVRDINQRLGEVLWRMSVHPESPEDDVIDQDLILVWGKEKRVITGADILGRLLRGIVMREA